MGTFLLELGTEELPVDFIQSALSQWKSKIPLDLSSNLIDFDTIEYFGTPRRLAILIHGMSEYQVENVQEVKGPAKNIAFKDGNPTPAALGFARKQGVEVSDFEIRQTDKGEFVFIRKVTEGRITTEAIADRIVSEWIFGLEGKRFMRWGNGDLKFSRPIRWLTCMWNDTVIPIEIINENTSIKSDRYSRGHRVLHPNPVVISHASEYIAVLESAYVKVDPTEREKSIKFQLQKTAETIAGTVEVPKELLNEVVFLVEWPTAVLGKFDAEFLQLPSEVVVTEMVKHQRYFPVRNSKQLMPYFITISNGDPAKSSIVASGNERVIRARLSDGQFFFKTDRTIPLIEYLPKLDNVTFQANLGSMREKVERIRSIAKQIVEQLKLSEKLVSTIDRAALLCKADLVTQMVREFPELQGAMGQKYALASKESNSTALAILEHYLPRHSEDDLPTSIPGQILAISDRLDTLVCIFGIGLIPSGSSDPFALRRSANGIVRIIWSAQLPLNLNKLLTISVENFKQTFQNSEPLEDTLSEFFLQRIRTLLQDEGIDYDLVNSVLDTDRSLSDLVDTRLRASLLQKLRNDGTLASIYEIINRALSLTNQSRQILELSTGIEVKYLKHSSEQALYEALKAIPSNVSYELLVQEIIKITPIVQEFLDSVLVMDEDINVRQARLHLIEVLCNYSRILADFSVIVKQ